MVLEICQNIWVVWKNSSLTFDKFFIIFIIDEKKIRPKIVGYKKVYVSG